jgi:spoIIIJ-associated protein
VRSVESEGGSIDEAIENALSTLHAERSQVEIEILENAVSGLLGRRKARVRATIRSTTDSTADSTADVPQETDDRARRAKNLLEQILPHLTDDARVEVEEGSDGNVVLAVATEDSGAVIGRRGQTLDALEHLVNRIVLRDERAAIGRVTLDVAGYRGRRQESLEELARRLAAKARQTGQIVTLNPLSPRDRRIVHLTLEPEPDVTTRSEGEGVFRRLLIVPERRPRR